MAGSFFYSVLLSVLAIRWAKTQRKRSMNPSEIDQLSELYAAETILENAYKHVRNGYWNGRDDFDALWILITAKQEVIQDRQDQQEPGRML